MTDTPPTRFETPSTERSGRESTSGGDGWRAVFLVVFTVLLAIGASSPPSGPALHRYAVGFDPTLSVSSLELVWAILSWPVNRLLEWTPLSIETRMTLLPALGFAAILTALYRTPDSTFAPVVFRWGFVLFFLFGTWIVSSGSGGLSQPTGPDVLVLGFLLMALLGPRSLAGVASGFLAGGGWVYCVLLALLAAVGRVRPRPGDLPSVLLGVGLNLSIFLLLRVRYPHPDLVTGRSPFGEWLRVWGRGGDAIDWSLGFASFPGVVWIGAGTGALLAVWGVRKVWRVSAGRTVPVQMALYSMVIVALGLVLGLAIRRAEVEDRPPSIEERSKNLRTLRAKLERPTELFLFPEDFGALLLLDRTEEVDPQLRVRLESGRTLFIDSTWQSERVDHTPDARVRVGYNGRNLVRIEGEPLRFAPQYLLDASVEVWTASPEFFVANNPMQATEQPALFHEFRRLDTQARSNLSIVDWNYDGRHFNLYKMRDEEPWSFPPGEWHVDYLGYLLSEDFDRYSESIRARKREGVWDYY